MDTDEIQHKRDVINTYKKRLQEREIQLANLGINADPVIKIEIQDIKAEIQRIETEIQQNSFNGISAIIDIHAPEEYKSHVKLYRDISGTLQSLVFAGDSLWNYATLDRLDEFKQAIQKVKQVIEINAVYFEPEDLKELREAVTMFERFTIGKEHVLPMLHDTVDTKQADMSQELRRQISKNARYKRRYEDLVEKIRISFKARIA
jgi:hypothetical protein